jgi:hypothetical protein
MGDVFRQGENVLIKCFFTKYWGGWTLLRLFFIGEFDNLRVIGVLFILKGDTSLIGEFFVEGIIYSCVLCEWLKRS